MCLWFKGHNWVSNTQCNDEMCGSQFGCLSVCFLLLEFRTICLIFHFHKVTQLPNMAKCSHPGIVVDNTVPQRTAASFGRANKMVWQAPVQSQAVKLFFSSFSAEAYTFSVILTRQSPFGAVAVIIIISKLFSWSGPSYWMYCYCMIGIILMCASLE